MWHKGVEKAATISGWMELNELDWLAQQAAGCTTVIEIGSWKGRSTRALAENVGSTVYAVDSFIGCDPNISPLFYDVYHTDFTEPRDFGPEYIREVFLDNMKGLEDKFVCVFADSIAGAKILRERKVLAEMIFIDASHDYDSIVQDIKVWMEFLVPGGLMSGHDISYDGMKEGISEFEPNYQTGVGGLWWFRIEEGRTAW